MSAISRRTALQALATAGAATAIPRPLRAGGHKAPRPDQVSILYDSTRCIGCRECALGCAEANDCDVTAPLKDDPTLAVGNYTVIQRFLVDDESNFLKSGCMHCVDPACVSACMLGAMHKDEDGAVQWNADLCVGCRYCQIACPFNVPRFEWDTPMPALQKCDLCADRRAEGLGPACVDQCRMGALVYGTREEMLEEAHARIDAHPDRYNSKVYGEKDGGGTSVLYLAKAGVSFADLGLPELGEDSVPSLPETIQHTLYKGMVAPLGLLAVMAGVVRRNVKKLHEEEAATHEVEHSEPVGGPLWNWGSVTLFLLAVAAVAVVLWRFAAGLGATTNLNDGYAMGLWIAFDVVTGTALACGGYAMALLVYVANRGKYHPLVRAALVTSALGYTLGGMSVLIDIGRAWNFYKIPLYFWEWNFNSILLEVALCIMLYTTVLWIEVSPAILEGWRESRVQGLRKLALTLHPLLERAMPYLIAVGLVLPTMHQSSLGSLMLLAGQKLHPLWHTPLLPLLFLVSCVGMGYAAVTLECCLSARVFKRKPETPMLRALATPISLVLLTYSAIRVTDILLQGKWAHVAAMDGYSLLFLGEMALFLVPAVALILWSQQAQARFFSAVALMIIFGGAIYRFSTYLFAFNPGEEWSYFPSLPEFTVTVGLVAAEILGYYILVKRFPILRGEGPHRPEVGQAPEVVPVDRVEAPRELARVLPQPIGHSGFSTIGAAALLFVLCAVGIPLVASAGNIGAATVSGGSAWLQESTSAVQEAIPADSASSEERRCLTRNDDRCLDEPVPVDEPHEAVCATCHDLWDRDIPEPEGMLVSCSDADCHSQPDTLAAFHTTVDAEVLDNCVGCHDPHDSRMPEGGSECAQCHTGPGLHVEWVEVRASASILDPGLDFDHETHEAENCLSCHGDGASHGGVEVQDEYACLSCHHEADVASSECATCHEGSLAPPEVLEVVMALDIEVGSLDRPRRTLAFRHELHEDAECRECHSEGVFLGVPANADCSSCHVEHHTPESNCASCHGAPAAGVHDVEAHLDCTGSGCHTQAPNGVVEAMRARALCLSCHRDLVDHEPDQACADCHLLPPPKVR